MAGPKDENEDEDDPLWVDVEDLEEIELRIIAEKVWEMLARDALFERERRGLGDRWSGWRQS